MSEEEEEKEWEKQDENENEDEKVTSTGLTILFSDRVLAWAPLFFSLCFSLSLASPSSFPHPSSHLIFLQNYFPHFSLSYFSSTLPFFAVLSCLPCVIPSLSHYTLYSPHHHSFLLPAPVLDFPYQLLFYIKS